MAPSAPYIKTISDFKNYIRRKLGQGVIRVEITDDQINDRINDALVRFIETADDGTQLTFKEISVNPDQTLISLADYDVFAIYDIFDITQQSTLFANTPFPQFAQSQYIYNTVKAGDLATYVLSNAFLSELNHFFKSKVLFDYNAITQDLQIIPASGWANHTDVMKIGLLYYRKIDQSDTSHIYDHKWVRDYATELCRRQWGYNIMKYQGTPLPGGVRVNADAILTEAKENIAKLEEDLEYVYQAPADFFVG